jgi:hypothetical protein
MAHLNFNVALARVLIKKRHMFYFKGNNNGKAFYTQSQKVILFYG